MSERKAVWYNSLMWIVPLALAFALAGCVRAGFEPPGSPGDRGPDRAPVDQAADRLFGDRPLDQGRLDASPDLGPCPDGCWIAGVCHAPGAANALDDCQVCAPELSAVGWGPAKGCVVTLAGDGTAAFADGPGLTARFHFPEEIALDASGRLYVADGNNHRIRVVDRGRVSTLAGSGAAGWADGPASTAGFNYPHGVTLDGGGAVFVGEFVGRRVRRITGGQVTTIAGDGTAGHRDGPALAARFSSVYSLAFVAGVLYLTDLEGNRIRALENGVVSTVAGDGTRGYLDGPALSARFDHPYGIAAEAGRLIVTEQDGHRIRRIESGLVSTLTGQAGYGLLDGPAASARLFSPNSVTIDGGGRIIFSECGNCRIRALHVGQVSTIAGSGGGYPGGFADGPVASARFACPTGVAVDSKGRIFVGDTHNNRVRVINP